MRKLFEGTRHLDLFSLVKRIGLCSIPVLVVTALLLGSSLALLAAVAVSVLFAFDSAPRRARPTREVDQQTGLASEADILSAIETAYRDADRKVACVLLEIDSIGTLKHQWGPDITEAFMPDVADRISSLLRESDIVARVGDTRFAIAVCKVRAPALGAIVALVDRLQKMIAEPMVVDGASLHLTASAGFCMRSNAPDPTAQCLYDSANAALDDAMTFAPYATRSFSDQTVARKSASSDPDNAAVRALKDGKIVPWFQPQISTDTGEITGFEALARWIGDDGQAISPGAFLPQLEAAHQMELLSETILINSLKALKTWDDKGVNVPSISVNFATQELRNPSLVERIKWDTDRFNIEPSRLTIEILETVISDSEDDVIVRNIRQLQQHGFKIDLDDFGTGHASLSNIRRFRVDRIKIDRSFVTHADEDPEQQRMIAAIVSMSEQLGIAALAEGVESVGERAILAQLGCTHLQGYAIARPMPLNETLGWISDYQSKIHSIPTLKRKRG
ncbi:MAG: GGDEF domain-containing phosphodiesterase [Pseudomonadota bacterium]